MTHELSDERLRELWRDELAAKPPMEPRPDFAECYARRVIAAHEATRPAAVDAGAQQGEPMATVGLRMLDGETHKCASLHASGKDLPLGTLLYSSPAPQAVQPVALNKFVIEDKLTREAKRRTSLENIEDVLAAITARYGRLGVIEEAPAVAAAEPPPHLMGADHAAYEARRRAAAPASGEAMPTEAILRGAIARGWCHPATSHLMVDPELVEAIAEEVAAMLPLSAPTPASEALTQDAERLDWLARQGDFRAYTVPGIPHDYELEITNGPDPDAYPVFKGEDLRECVDRAIASTKGATK